MKKILILGKDGQVGWELCRSLASVGEVVALNRTQADLAKPKQLIAIIREVKPEMIFNAAAYTAVDRAEVEPSLAIAINGNAPEVLAEEAVRLNAWLIHFSTDYVFNGNQQTPYRETDVPSPLNVYGHSKWMGEKAIQSISQKHLIFRISGIYGMRGRNFLLTMLKLAKEKKRIPIVDDQRGAPTWCRLVAQMTAQIVTQGISEDASGIYHMTAKGETSWFEFAKAIFDICHQKQLLLSLPEIAAISSQEYSASVPSAQRPLYSILSNEKLEKTFGCSLQNWNSSLKLCLEGIERT